MSMHWGSVPHEAQQFVFVDAKGIPLRIHAQASLEGRPRLIRKIKDAGGVISHDPSEARILLVDPETADGQLMANDWGSTAAHIILHVAWVSKSIERGSAFLACDNWGGYRVFGEGGPPEDELDAEDSERKSALPTPRQTPVESVDTPPLSHAYSRPIQGVPLPHYTSFQHADVGMNAFAMSPSAVPMVPPYMAYPSQPLPDGTFPHAHASMLQQQPPHLNVGNIVQTVFDILQHSGGMPVLSQATASPVATQFPLGFLPPHTPQQIPDFYRQQSVTSVHGRTSATPDGRAPTSSQSRSTNGSYWPDDSQRARKKPRYSDPSDISRSSSVVSGLSTGKAKKSKRRALFTAQDGNPLGFVVQVDLRNRMDVVHAIKSHGGMIKADIADADYVVLSPQSASFANLLMNAEALQKPAVQAAFVHDCVEQEKILDPNQYSFDEMRANLKMKRGRLAGMTSPKKSPKKERLTPVKKEKETEPRVSPTPTETSTSEGKAKKSQSQPRLAPVKEEKKWGPNRTPSPPPPSTSVPFSAGKARFTQEELDYTLAYANVLYRRDPYISWNAILTKIHSKMPQHTKNSWSATLSKKRAPFEDLQKKAAIQHRKMMAQKEAQAQETMRSTATPVPQTTEQRVAQSVTPAPEPRDIKPLVSTGQSMPEAPPSPPPPRPSTVPPDFESFEFKTIVEALAAGIAIGRSDDAVWATLGQEHPHLSARGWRDYWDMYAEWVQPAVMHQMGIEPEEPLAS